MTKDKKQCSIENCDKDVYCKGMCERHYRQMKKHGKIKEDNKLCTVINCTNKHVAKGLCNKHYKQMKIYNRILDYDVPLPQKYCKVPGCTGLYSGLGYCTKHYQQYKKYGRILERNMYTPNEIIKYNDYAEILLYDKENKEIARAIIDLDDVDKIKSFKWHLTASKYVEAYNGSFSIKLHRFIMDCPNDMVVDHINHDTLNNKKENLRICTRQENNFNRQLNLNNQTGYKGVYYQNNKYIAVIRYNGENYHLGTFDTAIDAAKEYNKKAFEFFGEYAWMNDIKEE